MSLKHAILVLLDREPGSGYDLTQRFARGIGHFWQASHQQIYHQLKKLDEEKLVRFATEAQAGKPDRKVYRITARGQRVLKQWIRSADRPPVVRDALLIKVFAAEPEDHAAILAELERHLAQHRQMLESHLAQEAGYFELDEAHRHRLRLPYLTLRRGIRYEREWIEWLEETRALIAEDRLPTKRA